MKCERMIPNIYEQSADMRAMCRFFDIEHELLEYYTNHILDCYSPEHCPKHLLPELAEHIGFDYQELKSVMYNRVVLKNFIKNMIRYRGSATGIANAAAIDIRYRQAYPETYWIYDDTSPTGVTEVEDPDAGKQIPMNFHESIDISKTWVDVDHELNIIYVFVIASDYFPKITPGMTDEEKQANYEERMRRLLDLAYLQEYVRPVGMYLLPMVANKVNPYTDLTVKSVVIPQAERNQRNGVTGTPNASMIHEYDRMLFTKVSNPDDAMSVEPWRNTVYHSQLAGRLKNQYFKKPVYHIEGKFLYYDHDELLSIYQELQQTVPSLNGMKIGDSLYNPNITRQQGSNSYGPEDSAAAEPQTLQELGVDLETYMPLAYDDHVGFPVPRVYQADSTIALPVLTEPDEPYPIYLSPDKVAPTAFQQNLGQSNQQTPSQIHGYLVDAYTGTHVPTLATPGDGDDGKNRNLMINLFQVDDDNTSPYTGAYDVYIAGKEPVDRLPVPYDPETNGPPTGDDVYWTVRNPEEDTPEDYIP